MERLDRQMVRLDGHARCRRSAYQLQRGAFRTETWLVLDVVRVRELPVGEQRGEAAPWILITTFPATDLGAAEIYRRRWQIEEFYKLLITK